MFINRVHEQRPKIDSGKKKTESKNQFEKPSQMHEHPASTPRCALARPGAHWRAQARAWPPYCGRVPGRVVERGRPCRRPLWLYCSFPAACPARLRLRPNAQRPSASLIVSWPWPSAVSQGPASCHSAPLAVSWA